LEEGLPEIKTNLGRALAVKTKLRFRQVHLDFHTSEAIEGVGAEFDPQEFVGVLAEAQVDSVTCFARCHHGWLYYDSKLFPERVHPHLVRRNLLGEQIEACHALNIRVPVYITVQWDHYTASLYPEWRVMAPDGSFNGTPLYEAGFYRYLCVNTPYRDFLKAQTQEVLEMFPVDGIFFDIVQPADCSCYACRSAMASQGLEPSDAQARWSFALQSINDFKREMTGFVRQFNPDCTIFYNAGHIGPQLRLSSDAYTHFELESLPSGGWGYLHFPMSMRYARNLGLDCMGMTGKFHTSWGDFHSFKNQAALQYEVFNMLALGAKCSIGDQLHPSGKISRATYDLVRSVYAEVEKKEPWCADAEPVVDIGVFTPEEFQGSNAERLSPALSGAVRVLTEGGHQFDVLDTSSNLDMYQVLVLPDHIPAAPALADRLRSYLDNGGSLIATYRSGLKEKKDEFSLRELGVFYRGPAPYSPDFIFPKGEIGRSLPETEHVMYLRGLEVAVSPETEILAEVRRPYFNRTYQHFCSHRQTPSSGEAVYPGIMRTGNVIYFAHPIFTQYNENAPHWCKTLLLNAIDLLLPQPLVKHNGPSTLQVTINAQKSKNRWVMHCLHYIPERRSQTIDIIEDIIPLYQIGISIKTSRPVENILLVPQQEAIPFQAVEERTLFNLPKLVGHQMVEIKFI
jgi:hypothetical protein